jgi:transcriptional regulator with PAS, ATPase and Fis domain
LLILPVYFGKQVFGGGQAFLEIKGTVNLADLFEHSGDGFFIADARGKLLYCNPATNPLVGMDLFAYENLGVLLAKKIIDRSTALEAIQKKSAVTGEVKCITGQKVIATSAPVFDLSGKLDKVVCNVRSYASYVEAKNNNPQLRSGGKVNFKDPYKIIQIKGQHSDYELVFGSSMMEEIIDLAVNLSKVDSTVLLHGETGVGKELIAHLIHVRSPRNMTGPFVKINCASIPINLVETELFGYEPGSFTGALKRGKKGYFELAAGGTLFLDEIGELPLAVQPKLLNVLQDKQVSRVGGTELLPVDVRIVGATNRDLKKMVEEGKFREDLYFRLHVVPMEVPPLRERKVEIPMLISYFQDKFLEKYAIRNKKISPEVIRHLYWYPWPGNIRELANLVERLLIVAKKNVVTVADLPAPYLDYAGHQPEDRFTVHDIAPLKEMTREFELAVITKAMEQSKSQKEAAEMLGISFSSLSRKLKG